MYSGYQHYNREKAAAGVTVEDPCFAWQNMEPHWILSEDLQSGTFGIRKKHRRYLPQEPRELDDQYDNRLARSVVAGFDAVVALRLQEMQCFWILMRTRWRLKSNPPGDMVLHLLLFVALVYRPLHDYGNGKSQ